MSLRARIAAVAGLAVAIAVLLAAVSVYIAVRSDLRGELDRSLHQRATAFAPAPGTHGPPPGGGTSGGGTSSSEGTTSAGGPLLGGTQPSRGDDDNDPFPRNVPPAPLGGTSGYVQFVSPDGAVHVPGGQGTSTTIPLNATDRAIARRGHGQALSDRTLKGTSLRVLTIGTGPLGATLVARPLTEVNKELSRMLLILMIVGVVGILIAAVLGAFVARTALAPIARFTRRTERLSGGLDLSQRLDVNGRDELARLARSFNATLDALERSVDAQRNLIADASHELRTPIASLRANIQVLADADRLPASDQASLRADIIGELDELTGLVSDVVELARGIRSDGTHSELALDEIVRDAVTRTRRRAQLHWRVQLEPTLINGEADRVNRAVANLLDNARKWSPADGLIEVDLHDGELRVRDHGPGFQPDDLPHVFERFYRADHARALPGSGLGLAIVRQTAEAHHGYAQAENAPGGGACVRVSFGPPLRDTDPQDDSRGEHLPVRSDLQQGGG